MSKYESWMGKFEHGARCEIEQYRMLKRCSEKKDCTEWNEWRKENRKEEIWLTGANLYNAHLEGANLECAHLEGANLQGADLKDAKLGQAHLGGAFLREAHLEGAFLQEAHLEGGKLHYAHLEGASLSWAHLEGASLSWAHLEGADLECAHLEGASLQEAHLEGANLIWAYLEGGKLHYAHLEGAKLLGAHLEGAKLECAHLEGAFLQDAHLEGAFLECAHLEGAFLQEAHLEGAKLYYTDLKGADLTDANLEGAKLEGAHLEGANLHKAHLEGADFTEAIVDGITLISACSIDKKTYFTSVALDNARVEQGLKQLLEYNVRRKNWDEWYKEHNLLHWPVRAFWLISDYGLSTGRVIGTFFVLAIIFGAVYYFCGLADIHLVNDLFEVENKLLPGKYVPLHQLLVPLRAMYFSIVTMTTLGFGDMYANPESWAGHILLMFQVILGYVLLGALVTRFAVLFTAGGPAGKFIGEKPWYVKFWELMNKPLTI